MGECFITRHGGVTSDDTYTYTMTENGMFQYPTTVTIPKNVTSFMSNNAGCFGGHTEVKKVQWEDESSMTSIVGNTFYNCTGLEDVVIPDTITNLDIGAFYGCTNLKNISLNTEVKRRYGNNCFYNCNLTTESAQIITESAQYFGSGVFYGNKNIKHITLPYLNTDICSGCTGLESAVVTANISYSGYGSLFSGCTSLKSVIFTGDIVALGSYCFFNCKALTSVTFPNNLTSLNPYIFSGCSSLKTMSIPHGVTTLGAQLFANCTSLTTVWLPNTVTSGTENTGTYQMFYGCTSLADIQLENGWNCNLVISAPTLTAASLKAMFESLADLTDTNTKTLTLGQNNYTTAIVTKYTPEGSSEEVSIATIATNKNWTLQA